LRENKSGGKGLLKSAGNLRENSAAPSSNVAGMPLEARSASTLGASCRLGVFTRVERRAMGVTGRGVRNVELSQR